MRKKTLLQTYSAQTSTNLRPTCYSKQDAVANANPDGITKVAAHTLCWAGISITKTNLSELEIGK